MERLIAAHINYIKSEYKLDNYMLDIYNNTITLKDYQYFISLIYLFTKNLNSLLLLWDTGYGKTLTAIYIIKNLHYVFPKWKIFLFIKKSLHISPWLETIEKYIDGKYRDNIIPIYYDSPTARELFNNYIHNIDMKTYRIFIIIDEAHHVITRSISKDNVAERYFARLYNSIRKIGNSKNNKLLCMTATPIINSELEYFKIMDLLRPNVIKSNFKIIVNNSITNINELYRAMYCICSYQMLNESDSLTDTGKREGFASKSVLYHTLIMSDDQSKLYDEADKIDSNSKLSALRSFKRMVSSFAYNFIRKKNSLSPDDYKKNIKKLLIEFKNVTDNIHFSDEFIEHFKNDDIKNYAVTSDNKIKDVLNYNILYNYSCKYIEACKIILNSMGKVLVYEPYVNFEGIMALKEYFKCFNISFVEYSSNISQLIRDDNLIAYNNINNINGDNIKVCVFSNAGSEGLSFSNVNDIIIIDIPWSDSVIKQIIGRSIRLNSHRDLPLNRQHVYVHILIAKTINNKSVDIDLLDILKYKNKIVYLLNMLFKASSFEVIYEKYKFEQPQNNDYIFNNIKEYNMQYASIHNTIGTKQLTPIYYTFDSNCTSIYNGYMDNTTDLIYVDKMVVAKIKRVDDNPIIIIKNDKLIYLALNNII